MTRKFIEQQMYTRERGGIFHNTDGYDTIAISEGLGPSFVKKYLHPFCIYHSPKTLMERGERDSSCYPEAATLFQPDTGELVIGKAVFVPADFTGTRSTYFMHNYIIPAARKEEWIKEPQKLFQMGGFQTSYDTALGKVLPQRVDVEYADEDILSVKNELLGTLGLTEANFKLLLFAVMSSIAGKKKVFISLNVPLQDYSKNALQLLELIYLYLPYAHRRKLGAITFTSKPETKNYIHVTFFEPGTINLADRSIEKQFIFDFAGSRISGVDIEGQQHKYLDFALRHFSEGKRMDEFHAFAEKAMACHSEEQKLELSSYYQLTAIYLTANYGDLPHDKISLLHSLLKFLQIKTDDKAELVALFLKIINEDKIAADKNSALDYIDVVISIYKIVPSDEALTFILDTLEHYQHDQLFDQLWKAIEQDNLTYQALIMFIDEHPDYGNLLELHLNERFNQAARIEDLHREVKAIRLQELTLKDIMAFGTVITKEPDVTDMLDVRAKETYLIVQTLYGLISNPSQAGQVNLNSLTGTARGQLNEILQRVLQNNPSAEQFPLLLVAFDTEINGVDYQALLEYLVKNSNDAALIKSLRKEIKSRSWGRFLWFKKP